VQNGNAVAPMYYPFVLTPVLTTNPVIISLRASYRTLIFPFLPTATLHY
jgi:hypothetical protein